MTFLIILYTFPIAPKYIAAMMAKGGPEEFKRNVREDLDRRRDFYCPEEGKLEKTA